jgi:hypothetical protein
MYLFIDGGNYGFKHPDLHEIVESDVEISDEVYNNFFKQQTEGKQFRVKDINGKTFEDIFEEIPQTTPVYVPTEVEKQLADLTFTLMMNGVI